MPKKQATKAGKKPPASRKLKVLEHPCDGHKFIERVEGVCGGAPVIVGTRIPVRIIAGWANKGKSVDEIVAMYPRLTCAQVHDALSYYYEHRAEIDCQLRESEEAYERAVHQSRGWQKLKSTLTKT